MNKFATLEDIVNLKWQFNWMVLEKCWNYHVPVYIRNNELKYTNYGIVYKKCMSDYEYDIFKRYLINDTNMALINSIYNAEGSIFSNKHKKVLCKYCNISDELDFSNYSLIDVNEEDKVNTRIKELKTIYKRIDK
jgi:hypothetical protein